MNIQKTYVKPSVACNLSFVLLVAVMGVLKRHVLLSLIAVLWRLQLYVAVLQGLMMGCRVRAVLQILLLLYVVLLRWLLRCSLPGYVIVLSRLLLRGLLLMQGISQLLVILLLIGLLRLLRLGCVAVMRGWLSRYVAGLWIMLRRLPCVLLLGQLVMPNRMMLMSAASLRGLLLRFMAVLVSLMWLMPCVTGPRCLWTVTTLLMGLLSLITKGSSLRFIVV